MFLAGVEKLRPDTQPDVLLGANDPDSPPEGLSAALLWASPSRAASATCWRVTGLTRSAMSGIS